jgi:hypothetical protein
MKLVRFNLLIALLITTISSTHAATLFRPGLSNTSEPTISQLIESVGLSANKEITDILSQQVPRLSYTGIAFIAAITGVFISSNGLQRLCKGIEEDNSTTTITGAAELSTGLSTVAASITAIYLLWRKR